VVNVTFEERCSEFIVGMFVFRKVTMFKSIIFTSVLGLSAALVWGADANAARVPVLLELFTSEGCSSCPPADRLLQLLDEKQPEPGADLIVLSEHVDYWDRLGWRDPFSSSQFTARQQEYTNRYNFDGVYTPQLVVDGRYGFVGSDAHETSTAVRRAIQDRKISIGISNIARNSTQVAASIELPEDSNFKGTRGILYVVLADNRQESHVARGENAGRALAHVAVARALKQVGTVTFDSASTKDVTLPIQPGSGANGLRLIAFIQDPKSGRVIGVAEQKL
jgi:hypothetical protein